MRHEPDCAWALLIVGLLACTLAFWVIISHPTAAERTRALDAVGKTTGVNWR